MLLDADPGVPGYAPRVWVYRALLLLPAHAIRRFLASMAPGPTWLIRSRPAGRHTGTTIKALNWYTSVRTKLDDPKYASWFVKFNGFSNTPYPGGQGRAENVSGTYHVPSCDWYNSSSAPAACSGFWHDQKQTPEHPGFVPCTREVSACIGVAICADIDHDAGVSLCSGGSAYPKNLSPNQIDGDCHEQCDCGGLNPCGEYVWTSGVHLIHIAGSTRELNDVVTAAAGTFSTTGAEGSTVRETNICSSYVCEIIISRCPLKIVVGRRVRLYSQFGLLKRKQGRRFVTGGSMST